MAQNRQRGPKHVFAGPAPFHPFDVILARPTDKGVTVSVLTYCDARGRIVYGEKSDKLTHHTAEREFKNGVPTEFVLSELLPDACYYYHLEIRQSTDDQPLESEIKSFHTQRRPGSPFFFTVQADSHLDQSTRPAVYERTLANAVADNPDFHIDLGDTFMTDKYGKNYKDALPQYIAQRYYMGRIADSAPLFLILGNHDGEKQDAYHPTADCMSVWACLTRKKFFPNPYPDGFYTGNKSELSHIGRLENYYAWHWGDALFVALDPFWFSPRVGRNSTAGNWARTLGKEQYDWLNQTLTESRAKYKFVFLHHLVGGLDENGRGGAEAAQLYEWGGKNTDGKDEFREKRPGWEMPIHDLLVKRKVNVVFHGHDHFFAKQELGGVNYVMVPQPGHPGFDRLHNIEEYGYLKGTFLPPSGHVRVLINADKITVDYVRTYLPESESSRRQNRDVGFRFQIPF